MSYECCTRWYRPPELLFGAAHYGAAVDAWSAGCVVAELALMRPAFRGDTDADQLARIFAVLGSPSDESWPDAVALRKYCEYVDASPPRGVAALLAGADAAPLAEALLRLDPNRRPSARDALRLPYFAAAPAPELRAVDDPLGT